MLTVLAFGSLLFLSGNIALAIDEEAAGAETARDADQLAGNEEADQSTREEVVASEQEQHAEGKYTLSESSETELNQGEPEDSGSDYEISEEERNLGNNDEPEGEAAIENEYERGGNGEEAGVESDTQQDQPEGGSDGEAAPPAPAPDEAE